MSKALQSQSEISALWPDFVKEVKSAKGVIIGTHLHPDGDAIGSALAISFILDQLDVEHEILCSDPPPYYLDFLPHTERIKQKPDLKNHSLAIVADLESPSRLGRVLPYFEPCPRLAVIDHHIPHEAPGDLRIVCQESPATSSIILDLITNTEIEITPDMANCLLTGILTDTGSFRYPNTDAHALHSAAFLLEHGADLPLITREVYMTRERPAVMLTSAAVKTSKSACNGRLAWATLPVSLFEELGANEQHSEGIANELLSIKGVDAAVVLRETTPNKIKGSLRSIGDIDVAAAAREFGGGGHMNAAGVNFDMSMKDAEEAIVGALKRCLESS